MEKNIEPDILEINGVLYRITEDLWTGDYVVDSPEKIVQPHYFLTKKGAINFCLVESSMVKRSEVEYEYAPDRTSAG